MQQPHKEVATQKKSSERSHKALIQQSFKSSFSQRSHTVTVADPGMKQTLASLADVGQNAKMHHLDTLIPLQTQISNNIQEKKKIGEVYFHFSIYFYSF